MHTENQTDNNSSQVVVFGAAGGVGAAFVQLLAQRADVACVHAVARTHVTDFGQGPFGKVVVHHADITHEAQIATVAKSIAGPVHLVIVATGVLHRAGEIQPEKDWRNIDPMAFAQVVAINAIGPALVFKHFAPLLDRDRRSVMVALSARVGSISDNRLGGWYSYRASKAALNQIIRTFSVELKRKNPKAIIAGLHPGTVETRLSAPFGSASSAKLSADESAASLVAVIDALTPEQSGDVLDWKGIKIPA